MDSIDYEIISEIGKGKQRKFNQVFLVKFSNNSENFILKKIIKSERNEKNILVLKNEAKFSFSHPNLPQIYSFSETEKDFCLFLKYKKGVSLRQYFQTLAKKYRLEFITSLIKQLTPLFNELNKEKLVHGDLNLENVLIDGINLDFTVHLIDFGLAFRTDEQVSRSLVFSLSYSAPELILNRLDLANQASDIYSLGIMIFHLLAERLPFTHKNPAILTNMHLNIPIPFDKKLTKDYFLLISKMTNKGKFPKPPNLLTNEKVEEILVVGLNERFQTLDEILLLIAAFKKKNTFKKKLVNIFSKSNIKSKI